MLVDAELRRLVWERASGTCEYCRIVQSFDPLPFCVDHIVAQKHHGLTVEENLALACYNCNSYKGPNVSGIDWETSGLTRLFNPRSDTWEEHFEWDRPELTARTAVGRANIDVLRINHPDRVEHRRLLLAAGLFAG